MLLTDAAAALRDEAAANAELKAWCLEKFGREATFYLGMNSRKPPKDTELPAVIFIPDGAEYDEAGNAVFTVGMVWAVNCPTVTADGNRTTYEGFRLSDEFGARLTESLQGVNAAFRISSGGYDLFDGSQFPTFPGERTLTMTEWGRE